MLFDSIENWPLLSDENKWRANEGVRKGSVVNFIAQLPSCGGCATQCGVACGGNTQWCGAYSGSKNNFNCVPLSSRRRVAVSLLWCRW